MDFNPNQHIRKTIEDMVLQAKGYQGFLSYSDYQIIESWIERYPDPDDLICILADSLASYFKKNSKRGLSQLAKKIDKTYHDNQLLRH